MIICPEDKCTGCGACREACPVQAIAFRNNALDFPHPRVDEARCISCGRCVKVCPSNSEESGRVPMRVLAAFDRDATRRNKAASGGVASAFGRCVVEDGGVVFGAVLRDDVHTSFECAETSEGVERFSGSKYVASDLGDAYVQVRRHLEQGRDVLFIGLPCQVAGLQACVPPPLAGKLTTVDLVCHGTPAAEYLTSHIRSRYGSNARVASFRDGGDYFLDVLRAGKRVVLPPSADLYYVGFFMGLMNRECCYSCRYARTERHSDLTIGGLLGTWRRNSLSARAEEDVVDPRQYGERASPDRKGRPGPATG